MSEKDEMSKLVKDFQNGNHDAFEKIYNSTSKYIYYSILKAVKDPEIASDIMQDTYLDVYKSLNALKSADAFKKWISVIAQHNITHYFSKNPSFQLYEDDENELMNISEEDVDLLPADALDNKETHAIISKVLDELPQKHRSVIIAFYYNQMSVKEIAKAMNIPENTVKTYMLRGKKKIKEGVLQVEKKQNIRLHSVGIGSVLFFVFGEEASACEPAMGYEKIASTINAIAGETVKSAIGQGALRVGKLKHGVGKAVMNKIALKAVGITASLVLSGFVVCGVYNSYQQNNIKEVEVDVYEEELEVEVISKANVLESDMDTDVTIIDNLNQITEDELKEDIPYEEVYMNEVLEIPTEEEMREIAEVYRILLEEDMDLSVTETFSLFDITGDYIPEIGDDIGTNLYTYNDGLGQYMFYSWVINDFYFDNESKQFIVRYLHEGNYEYAYYDVCVSADTPDNWLQIDRNKPEYELVGNVEAILPVHANDQATRNNMVDIIKQFYIDTYGWNPNETIVDRFTFKCPDCGQILSCDTFSTCENDIDLSERNYIDELYEGHLCVHYYCDKCAKDGFRKYLFDSKIYEWINYQNPCEGIRIHNWDTEATFFTVDEME